MPIPEQLELPFHLPFDLKKRRIRHCSWVKVVDIKGQTFELGDLWETLDEVRTGGIVITNTRVCEHLVALKVIDFCGSHLSGCGAGKGERFQEFFDAIDQLMGEEEETAGDTDGSG